MKNILKISLALSIAASSLAVTVPSASAQGRHHHDTGFDQQRCMDRTDAVLPILFIGAALGAVTGGVGSAVIWGSAYAVGGAAVGGGAGLLLSSADAHHHC